MELDEFWIVIHQYLKGLLRALNVPVGFKAFRKPLFYIFFCVHIFYFHTKLV